MKNPYEKKKRFSDLSRIALAIGVMMIALESFVGNTSFLTKLGISFIGISFVFYGLHWYTDYLYKKSLLQRGAKDEQKRIMVKYEIFSIVVIGFSIFYIIKGSMSYQLELVSAVVYIALITARVLIFGTEKR